MLGGTTRMERFCITVIGGFVLALFTSCAGLLPRYDSVLRSEYPADITQAQVRYPDGRVNNLGGILVPRASKSWAGFSSGIPETATVSWVDPSGHPKTVAVDVRSRLPKGTTEGGIVFTIRPDETVAVSFRESYR